MEIRIFDEFYLYIVGSRIFGTKRNDFVHGQMEVVFQWIPMTWAATAHLATLVEPFPSTDDLHWDFFHIAYPVLDGWLLFYGFSPMVAVVVVRNLRKIPARPVMRNRWLLIAKGGNSIEEDTLMMIRWPTVFEHCPKSRIQYFERREPRLHFEWKWSILASFWKPEACGQTVLPERPPLLIGQKLVENAKLQMRHILRWQSSGSSTKFSSRMMICLLGIWHRPQSRHYWRVTKEV